MVKANQTIPNPLEGVEFDNNQRRAILDQLCKCGAHFPVNSPNSLLAEFASGHTVALPTKFFLPFDHSLLPERLIDPDILRAALQKSSFA